MFPGYLSVSYDYDSTYSQPDSSHSHSIPHIPRIPTPIPCIPTPIPRIPHHSVPRFPIPVLTDSHNFYFYYCYSGITQIDKKIAKSIKNRE